MDKVVRDGKVAVLIHNGYGAGWSTAQINDFTPMALFNPTLVKAKEESWKFEDVEAFIKENDPSDDFYLSDRQWDEVIIMWVDEGREFYIDEYDGFETIGFKEYIDWFVA